MVWYTGDDFAARVPAGLGTQNQEIAQVREMLNYANGRLFATGQDISYLPFALPNSYSDDFWQYYMGAQTHLEGAGINPDTLLPYQVKGVDCNPIGLTGEWHAITGSSGVWREIDIDLSAYAGETVELYITYASDWGTQNLGVFLDDIALAGRTTEGFETSYGAWAPQSGPDGEPTNNWNRIAASGFPEGVGLRTPNSVFLGFGLEGIATAQDRAAVMDRVLRYLD